MKIKFLSDIALDVVTNIDDDAIENSQEVFLKGETAEIDICDDEKHEIQFGDGSMTFVTDDFWNNVLIVENDEMLEKNLTIGEQVVI